MGAILPMVLTHAKESCTVKPMLFFLALIIWSLSVAAADATTVQRLSLDELTDRAELIVLGQHLETKSVWVGRLLVTRVTVTVGELLKGQAPATVTVDVLGGIDMKRKVPLGMNVPGAPRIGPSEQVILFLSRQEGLSASGEYEIVGFSQGKFSIIEGARGRRVSGIAIPGGATMPLNDFKAHIEKRISRQLRE